MERTDFRPNSYKKLSIKRTVIKRTLIKADNFFCTKWMFSPKTLPIKRTLQKIDDDDKYFPPKFLHFFILLNLFQTFYNFFVYRVKNLFDTFFYKLDSFFRADEYVLNWDLKSKTIDYQKFLCKFWLVFPSCEINNAYIDHFD